MSLGAGPCHHGAQPSLQIEPGTSAPRTDAQLALASVDRADEPVWEPAGLHEIVELPLPSA